MVMMMVMMVMIVIIWTLLESKVPMTVGVVLIYILLFIQSLQCVMSIHVLMEVPVHNMGTMLPALAQWDILEICVKVYLL